jgi:hypothetical protein
MPTVSRSAHLKAGIAICLTASLSELGAPSAKRTLVEFWHVGDDGLSQRLRDEVESAFQRSSDFTSSSGKKPGTLVVYIFRTTSAGRKSSAGQRRFTPWSTHLRRVII